MMNFLDSNTLAQHQVNLIKPGMTENEILTAILDFSQAMGHKAKVPLSHEMRTDHKIDHQHLLDFFRANAQHGT